MNRRAEPVRVVDEPVAGYYRIRRVKGGPFVAARTFQRLGFWGAEIGGFSCGASDPDPFKADGVMAICNTGIRITKDEYDALIGKPALLPERKIDLGALPPPEF